MRTLAIACVILVGACEGEVRVPPAQRGAHPTRARARAAARQPKRIAEATPDACAVAKVHASSLWETALNRSLETYRVQFRGIDTPSPEELAHRGFHVAALRAAFDPAPSRHSSTAAERLETEIAMRLMRGDPLVSLAPLVRQIPDQTRKPVRAYEHALMLCTHDAGAPR